MAGALRDSSRSVAAWLTNEPPKFNGGGGAKRQAHLLRALSRDFDVDLYVTGKVTDPAVLQCVRRLKEVPQVLTPPPSSNLQRRATDLLQALSPRSLEVALCGSDVDALAEAVAGQMWDVALVEHAGLAPLLRKMPSGRPKIITFHNRPGDRARQAGAIAASTRERWLWKREATKTDALERLALHDADLVLAVTRSDQRRIGQIGTTVIPNGTVIPRTVSQLTSEPVVCITASLDYRPNEDGVMWFVDKVWPLVHGSLDSARLIIAGRNPTAPIRQLAGRNSITVVADPVDMWAILELARVAVVPLRIGSGSRLKALEAMALGRPVVGTSIGLEGLDITDGVQALIADSDRSFARQVELLLSSDVTCDRLVTAGRAHVANTYNWESIGVRFSAEVHRVMTSHHP